MESTDPGPASTDQTNTLYLYVVALIAAVGGFLFGYDLQLMSAAILFLKEEFALSPFWYGLVTGSAILGCPFGPLVGVWMADGWGRKNTLIIAAVLFMISAIGSAVAPNMIQLIIWRFIGGMGVGLASAVSPMYIAEIAPPRMRGRLVVVNQLAIVIGLSLAVYVCYFLAWGEHWRWMFASEAVPVVWLMVGLVLVPRSPRWLAARGRHDEALAVLTRVNGHTQAETELGDIVEELREETGTFGELLRPGVRLALIIGIILMVFSQINGVNMILIYAPTLFMEAGTSIAADAILNSVYIYTWITLCTVVAFWLTGRFARRAILIVGVIGMAAGHVIMFVTYAYSLSSIILLMGMVVTTGAFTLSLAPLSWVILSEIFPNRVRGKGMSLATATMFIASYITVNVFPILLDAFKQVSGHIGATFLIFMGICLVCAAFVWLALPETKDKPLEEIGRFWLHQERKRGRNGSFEKQS